MKKKIKQKPDYRRINELRQFLFYIVHCVEFVLAVPCLFLSNYDTIAIGMLVLNGIVTIIAIFAFIKKDPFIEGNNASSNLYKFEIFPYIAFLLVVGYWISTFSIFIAVLQIIVCGAMVIAFILLGFRNQIRRWYLKKKEEKRLANKNK